MVSGNDYSLNIYIDSDTATRTDLLFPTSRDWKSKNDNV